MLAQEIQVKYAVLLKSVDPFLGGPLMHYNHTTSANVRIGTVQGTGYDCQTDTANLYEDSDNGMWNKVSHWVDWIKE